MNKIIRLGLGAAVVAGLLPACGGDSMSTPGAPMSNTSATVDSQKLLQMARVTSESSDPMLVANSALVLADQGDETSDPLSVN